MQIKNIGRFWFTAALLVFTLIIISFSFQYTPKARILPLITAIPTGILCIFLLFAERYPRLIAWFDVSLTDIVDKQSNAAAKFSKGGGNVDSGKGVLINYIWMVGYFLAVVFIGFLVATPLFTLFYMKLYWRVSWLVTLAITISMFLIVHFGFNILMHAGLFEGVLFGGIAPPL
ncbi:tripartite tricarboxylate transporter TctB family protein [Chloroflexota bacterium]